MDKKLDAIEIANEVFDIEVGGIREVQKSLGQEFLTMIDKKKPLTFEEIPI